tara:strand:- start:6570 stop:8030 length:1461 start_codon:yes stop_codon:yes gene_type:complete
MLLAEAANIAEGLRNFYRFYMTDAEERSKYFRRIVDLIRQGVNNSIDDSSQLIDMYYPEYSKYQRQFISFHELREDICKKLSISPLVWDESMAGKPVVPLLALESAEYGGQGLTVKQALNLMARIKDEGFFQIASKMNEKEALLFWGRATDERPPMPVNRFLQAVSYATDRGAQSLQSINVMLQTMSPTEIIQRLYGDTQDMEVRTMQPGQPFLGPIYKAWDKMTTPEDVYAEVITGERRYLHITEFPKGTFKGVLYNRHKQVFGKMSESMLPYTEAEAVFEVEMDGSIVTNMTDVYALGNDWDIYKQDYKDRAALLENLKLEAPVKAGKFVPTNTDFNYLLETLEDNERLRLLSTGPIRLGNVGGWVILKDAFHIRLLVTAVRRDEAFETHARLCAMDGYETYEIGQLQLSVEVAQHMRQRLAHQGVLAGQDWIPVDEYAMVVVVELSEFSLSDLTLGKADIRYLDDGLGYSDVSQLTDLIEMSA